MTHVDVSRLSPMLGARLRSIDPSLLTDKMQFLCLTTAMLHCFASGTQIGFVDYGLTPFASTRPILQSVLVRSR